MSNVITLPSRAKAEASTAHYLEVAVYGRTGSLTVTLARREDAVGWLHVLLLGSAVGLEIVATLPDDEKGRAVADFVGPAVLRTAELTETEIAAQPEAC
ncbi:hypothetical protein ASG32_31025 [Methylobacterium sp. Leaf361]|uniref:hypothetical protein n=1 Tax=Methylobacterium sp. Leaf361 TaxID=1736352 RepID=UPI0006FE3AA7|nr:hypothetical protein [Methylobacterium sp. Leaf361]KQS65044.1 hypothetical protein ASG32_31025 [Methylobacterium sp. Leaf361]